MSEKKKKIAFVTGANRGLGFEISRQLCFKGYKVYMGSRNQSGISQSSGLLRGEGHEVEHVIVDVTDHDSIDAFVKTLESKGEKLDALINNAGVLLDEHERILDTSHADILTTLETNTIAPLILTRKLLPRMNEGCRVVMMSSRVAQICEEVNKFAPIYTLSKTGLNVVTRQLALELTDKNIIVNAVTPGRVRTSMGGSDAPRSVNEGAETPVWLATEVSLSETGKFWFDKKEIPW